MRSAGSKKFTAQFSKSRVPIRVNLQLFADSQKTEKATPKRRKDARKKGQVLYSREISSALVLLFVFLTIKALKEFIYNQTSALFRASMNLAINFNASSINEIMGLLGLTMLQLLKIVGPFFAVSLVAGVGSSYAQVGSLFTTEPLKPKLSRINPINGVKRIFSLRGLIELLKAILKIIIIGVVAWKSIQAETNNIARLMNLDLLQAAGYIVSTSINVAIKICLCMVAIAVLDFLYQWWQYERDLRMTKQEVKEEYKETEGNPETKQRIRSKMREISTRRMLSEVPKADVVITNPTHYAVAILYDADKAPAPVVIAKGQDYIAMRIKEVAKEHGVEIVENREVAQALYKNVEIGQQIPPELYQAVAEILAFVYRLKGKAPAQA
ncbi:flagellar biosynthetic protein FlhB [Thermoclostridium stercorarium subsp. stercorarium DSM 8532]|uniref:Flagellar biosynthetic protein FlhB n=2 Tax=Thermoclostridium stercorarium TaxID=1510 RepID=M4Y181_THES1|nr:flagellar biosynthesis protein FlhB [Thermoclostridium stercorarium]AGC67603.1 flagellar biosynthetic protein FlhB [Thermoclostridium stercorarium subsp. stercorarium DSM 8532]AGI38653.1 FlhB [Thermoclostridium stercorarium subsp. stercorarium DSM 8532]ANW98025.1 flagellar biosynthesis protein FlhB [Thermoclostridium stercorarium subsp. thermolacticum DSM 2910]